MENKTLLKQMDDLGGTVPPIFWVDTHIGIISSSNSFVSHINPAGFHGSYGSWSTRSHICISTKTKNTAGLPQPPVQLPASVARLKSHDEWGTTWPGGGTKVDGIPSGESQIHGKNGWKSKMFLELWMVYISWNLFWFQKMSLILIMFIDFVAFWTNPWNMLSWIRLPNSSLYIPWALQVAIASSQPWVSCFQPKNMHKSNWIHFPK